MYSVSIRSNNIQDRQQYIKTPENKDSKKRKINKQINSINANDVKSLTNISVENRKNNARRKAWKIVSDAWKKDQSLQSTKQKIEDKMSLLSREINEEYNKISSIKEKKDALKKEYGISEESEEQKTLELLYKYQNNMFGVSHDSFTDEEKEKLRSINTGELTEYQKRALSFHASEVVSRQKISDKELIRIEYVHVRRDLRQTELKSQDMIKASKASEEIEELANKDLIAFLTNEVKNKIEADNKEKQKEIQEAKEKKIEEKANSNISKEEQRRFREEVAKEEIITNASYSSNEFSNVGYQKNEINRVNDIQTQIDEVVRDNKILNEDLKGIEIDLSF